MWAEIDNDEAAGRAEQQLKQLAWALGLNVEQYKALQEARKRLGLDRARDVNQIAADLGVLERAGAPLAEIQKARLDLLLEKKRQGIALTKEEMRALRELQKEARQAAADQASFWEQVQNRLSGIFQDTAKDIADLIFKGGKFKDMMVGALEQIGKALARLAIERTFASIGREIAGIVSKLPGLARIASILGGGGSAAGSAGAAAGAAAATASTAGQIASQTAGTVGKVIGSSFASLAGVVTGAISAVTGVIGVFQAARQEGSLNAIEWNTRKASIHLEDILHRINDGIPGFRDVIAAISSTRDVLIGWDQYITRGLAASASGANVTINMAGASFIGFRDLDAFLDELVRRLKQRGL